MVWRLVVVVYESGAMLLMEGVPEVDVTPSAP
jgi:hypothetical protein